MHSASTRNILAGILIIPITAFITISCGSNSDASDADDREPAAVTATFEAEREAILNRTGAEATRSSRARETPTATVEQSAVAVSPSATTASPDEPTPTATLFPPYDLDAVPEMPAPEKIKNLSMPESEADILTMLEQLPDNIGSSSRGFVAGLHDGSNGIYGASYADNSQNPPTFMDVYITHNPTVAASPNISDRYKNPEGLPVDDAAQGIVYGLSDDIPADVVAELRIISVTGGRDGDLYWLEWTMEHGISLQWAYRGSPWSFSVSGDSHERLDTMVNAVAMALSSS